MSSPRQDAWLRRDHAHLWHPFTQADEWESQSDNLVIARGDGVWLEDVDGRRYLDGTASLWCNVLGHRHPRIDAAIQAQLGRIAHSTMLGLTHPGAIEHAERLSEHTGLPRVFYSDSGSTAVEVALKMAFQGKQQLGEVRRTRFAAFTEAYHGDTVGSVSLGGIDLFHAVYRPLLFDAVRLPAPDAADPEDEARCLASIRRLLGEHGDTLAAVVVEPLVQGAAGLRHHSPAFLREVAALTREVGAFLVVDEVATGFGRTGPMFASVGAGVQPDFLCVAKAITGGYLPLAATLTTEAVYDAFRGPYTDHRTFFHGHTYTGNPLAIAAANATLDVYAEERVLAQLPGRIAALQEALARLDEPWVAGVRQVGLMAAVELQRTDGTPYAPHERAGHRASLAARKHGAIVRNLGDRVMVMPPLVMEPPELRAVVAALAAGAAEVCG